MKYANSLKGSKLTIHNSLREKKKGNLRYVLHLVKKLELKNKTKTLFNK